MSLNDKRGGGLIRGEINSRYKDIELDIQELRGAKGHVINKVILTRQIWEQSLMHNGEEGEKTQSDGGTEGNFRY